MNKKILIALNHPAHYHLFKNIRNILTRSGYEVRFFIKDKEILEKLMQSEKENYFKYKVTTFIKDSRSKIIIGGILDLLIQDITLFWSCLFQRPIVMLGTDIAISHIGWLMRIRSLVFNEDDLDVNRSFCSFTYPFATNIISPNVCDAGKYSYKKIGYDGYQKLAYLHPEYFTPDRAKISDFVGEGKYFLIRLVSLSAGHDIEQNHRGMTYDDLRRLLVILQPHGKVCISSEKPVIPEFDHLKLNLPINLIHHFMFFCDLFVSDSQSMTMECCMLGVPNIRINTFVGKISVLEELEKKYRLTTGLHPDDKSNFFNKVEELIQNESLRSEFQIRRAQMLSDKIDVNLFFYNTVMEIANK
jgi:predicted glycosyltransferase